MKYKDLGTCSGPKVFGAALNMETSCRRRKSKTSFFEEEAMMAALSRLSFKSPFLRALTSQPSWTGKLFKMTGLAAA